ncbi:hypothetical protein E0K83_10285 [Gramella sp. BOM4]|nr:hypothetical protein [Christiangramia bathymodioli]
MSHNLKVFLVYFISFIAIFMIFRFLFELLFPDMDHLLLVGAAALITVILSPKLDKDRDSNSNRYRLRSIFRKKPFME